MCTDNTTATDCFNPGGSVVETTGISRATESGTVSGLTAGTPYRCWVKAVNSVGTVCSLPVVPHSVIFSLRYADITSTSFTTALQNQVCNNILQLENNGICEILNVLPGSAVVTGTVTYPSKALAESLVQQLGVPASASTLLISITGSTSVTVDAAFSGITSENPTAPDPPTAVVGTANDTNCPTAALDVSFTAPANIQGIVLYLATCDVVAGTSKSSGQPIEAATMVQSGASTVSIPVGPLSVVTEYTCKVQSATVQKLSTVATATSTATGCPLTFPVLAVNFAQSGNSKHAYYSPDLAGSPLKYPEVLTPPFLTSSCSLDGKYGTLIKDTTPRVVQVTQNIAPDLTQNPMTVTWTDLTSPFSGGIAMFSQIGSAKQGVYGVDVGGNTIKLYYTTDMTVSSPSFGTAIDSPSAGNIRYISLSGTSLLGITATTLHFIQDLASPSWTTVNFPSGITITSQISLSGKHAVVTKGKQIFYTLDVTAATVSWTEITSMPTEDGYTTSSKITGVSISGKQVVFTTNRGDPDYQTPAILNTYYAYDFTNVLWAQTGGTIGCVSLSAP